VIHRIGQWLDSHTPDIQTALMRIGLVFAIYLIFSGAVTLVKVKRQEELVKERKRNLHRSIVMTKIGIVTFESSEPPERDKEIKNRIIEIVVNHPGANLETYEDQIGAKIIRVDRKGNEGDDIIPIGRKTRPW